MRNCCGVYGTMHHILINEIKSVIFFVFKIELKKIPQGGTKNIFFVTEKSRNCFILYEKGKKQNLFEVMFDL